MANRSITIPMHISKGYATIFVNGAVSCILCKNMTMTDTISDIAVISSMSTNIFKIMSITEFTIMASTPTMLSSMISPKFTTDRIKLNVKIMIYMAGRMMNHAKIAKNRAEE